MHGEDGDWVLSLLAGDKTYSRLCSVCEEACGEQSGKEREAGGEAGTAGEQTHGKTLV